MTKGEKKYLITTGIIFLVGLALLLIGIICGGVRQGLNLATNVGTGAVNLFSNFAGYDNFGDLKESFDPFANLEFDLDEIPYEGEINDFEQFDMDDVECVKILVAGGDVDIKEKEETKYGIDAAGKKVRYFMKGSTLYVTADAIDGTIYLPRKEEDIDLQVSALAGDIEIDTNISVKEFNLYSAAGNVEIASLNAENSKLELMAGNLEIDNMDVDSINASVLLGNVQLSGNASEKIELSGIGNIELALDGDKNDYNYDISVSVGNIALDDSEWNGVSLRKIINNKADCDVILSANTGNIAVSFK